MRTFCRRQETGISIALQRGVRAQPPYHESLSTNAAPHMGEGELSRCMLSGSQGKAASQPDPPHRTSRGPGFSSELRRRAQREQQGSGEKGESPSKVPPGTEEPADRIAVESWRETPRDRDLRVGTVGIHTGRPLARGAPRRFFRRARAVLARLSDGWDRRDRDGSRPSPVRRADARLRDTPREGVGTTGTARRGPPLAPSAPRPA